MIELTSLAGKVLLALLSYFKVAEKSWRKNTMAMEVELKFLLQSRPATELETLLKPMVQQLQAGKALHLRNGYYDTPEHWFQTHGMGLRSRQQDHDIEHTIKLAGKQHGALHARQEYNVQASQLVPQLAAFPVTIWPEHTDVPALQQQLTELFRTDFCRKPWLLTLANHTLIELVQDEGQIITADSQQPICELELELKSGDVSQIFVLARQLVAALPLRLGVQSKAERGYRLTGSKPLQVKALPTEASPMVLLRLLQHNEACYMQEQSPDAMLTVSLALNRIAQWLKTQPTLQRWQPICTQLSAKAAQSKADQQLFYGSDYNLLLLALSEYFLNAEQ
ncbi:CYTH domain-containing protein [Alkalimonas sp. MEB108]|uniref:CYTH domain-containing protein n=1 Tax=Alkalimonas cellulosilytica TaxID=3058395 RepID=A0ABU7J9A2_9GAMM|nr:CYTH domain-containing protein [Alkalimonas sp. MEB108]MEE2002450.1 CYTH domain-containing protein [Alkalimonas sp. MEB108]